MFLSAPLPAPIRISGSPTVTLKIKADSVTTPVTARLIEYGEAEVCALMGCHGRGVQT